MPRNNTVFTAIKNKLRFLGPGLVTGAADDDPSGIATFSQAGAVGGLSLLWTAPFVTPFMIAIQEMCARIGLVTGKGLIGVLAVRKTYRRMLIGITVLTLIANTINIGADIAGMAAATHLLIPIPSWIWSIVFAAILSILPVVVSYRTFARYLTIFTATLLLYIAVPFVLKVQWGTVLSATLHPQLSFGTQELMLIVALFGTTISPYLFFWQADMEIENKASKVKTLVKKWFVTKRELHTMREDVGIGMIFSNLVMWFIILTTALTLHPAGIVINTAQDAALALRPIAGQYASLFFMIGIVGTGMLAIPVLAGSSSFALSEAMGWKTGLNKPFHKVKKFYLIMIFSTLVGVFINFIGISPIKLLIYTAVLYGVISPMLILLVLRIANDKKLMGNHTNSPLSNIFGIGTFVVMTTATVLFFLSLLR